MTAAQVWCQDTLRWISAADADFPAQSLAGHARERAFARQHFGAGFLFAPARVDVEKWHRARCGTAFDGIVRRAGLAGYSWSEYSALILPYRIDAKLCLRCGRGGYGLEEDHIVPRSFVGDRIPLNLQPLCGACNRWKSNRIAFYGHELNPLCMQPPRSYFTRNIEALDDTLDRLESGLAPAWRGEYQRATEDVFNMRAAAWSIER